MLWTGRRVEVSRQERGEVTGRRIGEKISLRLHAARREDRDLLSGVAPALECRPHVGVDLAFSFQLTRLVARFPNPPLQRLERRRFAVAVHQPVDVGFGIPGWKTGR